MPKQGKTKKTAAPAKPSMWDRHVAYDGRISFSIIWFATEEEADYFGAEVRAQGRTRNGGYFHGMPLGRDKSWDRVKDGQKQWAVTC